MLWQVIDTPLSLFSCSAEASKNKLRQKHSVNIKGMQRRGIIIHLSTEVEKENFLMYNIINTYVLWLESVLLLTNKIVL